MQKLSLTNKSEFHQSDCKLIVSGGGFPCVCSVSRAESFPFTSCLGFLFLIPFSSTAHHCKIIFLFQTVYGMQPVFYSFYFKYKVIKYLKIEEYG